MRRLLDRPKSFLTNIMVPLFLLAYAGTMFALQFGFNITDYNTPITLVALAGGGALFTVIEGRTRSYPVRGLALAALAAWALLGIMAIVIFW